MKRMRAMKVMLTKRTTVIVAVMVKEWIMLMEKHQQLLMIQ
jgi:hypothetical protein